MTGDDVDLVKPTDLSTSNIREIFNAMTKHITCPDCLKGRDERVNKIVVNWSMTKVSRLA